MKSITFQFLLVLTVLLFGLPSAGRSAEYTEVPLGALDIAAADSLTLSPHPGRCKMDMLL